MPRRTMSAMGAESETEEGSPGLPTENPFRPLVERVGVPMLWFGAGITIGYIVASWRSQTRRRRQDEE